MDSSESIENVRWEFENFAKDHNVEVHMAITDKCSWIVMYRKQFDNAPAVLHLDDGHDWSEIEFLMKEKLEQDDARRILDAATKAQEAARFVPEPIEPPVPAPRSQDEIDDEIPF